MYKFSTYFVYTFLLYTFNLSLFFFSLYINELEIDFFSLGELKRGKISEMFEFYLLLSIFTLTERKKAALQV